MAPVAVEIVLPATANCLQPINLIPAGAVPTDEFGVLYPGESITLPVIVPESASTA